jgi:hypothetical protein
MAVLREFRSEFYRCPAFRADALFELADAALCADGPVRTLVDLALAPECRRGHGAMYDATAVAQMTGDEGAHLSLTASSSHTAPDSRCWSRYGRSCPTACASAQQFPDTPGIDSARTWASAFDRRSHRETTGARRPASSAKSASNRPATVAEQAVP